MAPTRDQWNRNVGEDLSATELARQMKSPVKTVSGGKAPTNDEAVNRLYEQHGFKSR